MALLKPLAHPSVVIISWSKARVATFILICDLRENSYSLTYQLCCVEKCYLQPCLTWQELRNLA
jgi:hypothetical protein